MGTHPIFESDFDCLTDFRSDMRAELCHFSGLKIHPGHGMNHCKADGKVIRLLSSKSAALFHNKTNPRKLRWTILYQGNLWSLLRRTPDQEKPVQGGAPKAAR